MRLQNLLAVRIAVPVWVTAQTYQCKQAEGYVSFQHQACQNGSSGSHIAVRPIAPSADPAEIEKMTVALSDNRLRAALAQKVKGENKARNRRIDAHH